MKKAISVLVLLALTISLTGCFATTPPLDEDESGAAVSSRTSSVSSEDRTASIESQLATEVMTPLENGTLSMARVDIVTKSTAENVMDFVTKPVAGHVAYSISTYTKDYVIPIEPYYEDCSITVTDTNNQILIDGADAQVKVRGSWTTSYAKKSLRIKFDKKQSMLDLNNGAKMKNWVLLAEYKDSSMLRNKTAFQIAREILEPDGYYCTDAEFVEVTINGNYWGVYLLAEQQQIDENRVNINEAEEGYTGTDIGYLIEFDGYYYTEDEAITFCIDYHDNASLTPYNGKDGYIKPVTILPKRSSDEKRKVGFTIKSDIYCEEQRNFIANFVDGVYDIMYEAAYNDKAYEFNADYTELVESDLTPRQAIEKVVDMQSLVNIYIISELVCDADVYWSSFFMSVDFSADGNRKLTFTAPWDFDSSMGNIASNRCLDAQGYFATVPIISTNNKYEALNPWLTVLAYEDWYREEVYEKWTQIYDSGVFDRALEQISNDRNQYADNINRNYLKWNNLSSTPSFTTDLSQEVATKRTYKAACNFLTDWLEARVEFLNNEWHK